MRQLNDAASPEDMDIPGWNLHPLKGQSLKGHWSVWVNGNWRLIFMFEGHRRHRASQGHRSKVIAV